MIYIFWNIFFSQYLPDTDWIMFKEKNVSFSIHDHQLTSSYRDQVYFAGMRWQREAQNHKLPFAWFTPLGTGSSVGGAVKVQILFNCGGIAVIPLIDFHLNYEMIDAPRQFCQYHSRWEESWDCFLQDSYFLWQCSFCNWKHLKHLKWGEFSSFMDNWIHWVPTYSIYSVKL